MTSRKARRFRAIFARNFLEIHIFSWNIDIFRNYHVIKRIWNKFSFHTVFMKLVVCLISPRHRLGDIKNTSRFINTVWNENSFQILYISWNIIFIRVYNLRLPYILVNVGDHETNQNKSYATTGNFDSKVSLPLNCDYQNVWLSDRHVERYTVATLDSRTRTLLDAR